MTTTTEENKAKEAAKRIAQLVEFALNQGLIERLDTYAAHNALLDFFGITEPSENAVSTDEMPETALELVEELMDYAAGIGLLENDTTTHRDLLYAKIMGMVMQGPSQTAGNFAAASLKSGIKAATDQFYKLSIDSGYIRMDRIKKNSYWRTPTSYGDLEITINLSKPEKDPKEIALLKTAVQSQNHYPKCLLCIENVGYAGRIDHPARQNLRVIPLELQNKQWYFQYSPYVYYNEHCIIFSSVHEPMRTSVHTLSRLLDFVDVFPHYFIGSNADLPIVGGSILNHDHYQGGRHSFPMELAKVEKAFTSAEFEAVRVGIVKWPMSVVRLSSKDRAALHGLGSKVMEAWRSYSDPAADIYAYSDHEAGKVPHNTITPTARINQEGEYELDLVLRNNRTSDEHPHGIFHPHQNLHHIKRENIGLIEVMGLAVLPGRLQVEIQHISTLLTGETVWSSDIAADDEHELSKHADWIVELLARYGTELTALQAEQALKEEVGLKFAEVLHDAGVYKRHAEGQEAFVRFLKSLSLTEIKG